jgi:hypothetical protein
VRNRKVRQLTKAELRVLGVTPGLIALRVSPDGRTRLEQLAPESPERRRDFARRLTGDSKPSERSKTA